MDENKVENLIQKLNVMLSVDGEQPSVSPALSSSGEALASPDTIFIDSSLNVEKLTHDQILLVHVLLHRFYASGNKELDNDTIEILHSKVAEKMNHSYFDRLDK